MKNRMFCIPEELKDDFSNYILDHVTVIHLREEKYSAFWLNEKTIEEEDCYKILSVSRYFECGCGLKTADDGEMLTHVFEKHFKPKCEKEGLL